MLFTSSRQSSEPQVRYCPQCRQPLGFALRSPVLAGSDTLTDEGYDFVLLEDFRVVESVYARLTDGADHPRPHPAKADLGTETRSLKAS